VSKDEIEAWSECRWSTVVVLMALALLVGVAAGASTDVLWRAVCCVMAVALLRRV